MYGWLRELQLHFEALGLWQLVTDAPTTPERNEVSEDTAKKEARCKRDILLALEEDLRLAVRHLATARDMYKRVKKMFLGGISA